MGGYALPPDWADNGARWGKDGQLYLREWRRGFTVHELRAFFWEIQQAAGLRAEVKNLTSTVESLAAELAEAQKRAAFYRSQLVAESRLGLALTRIVG